MTLKVVDKENAPSESVAGSSCVELGEAEVSPLERAMSMLGPFGLYQRYVLFMLCLPNMLSAMYSLNFVFVADRVPFRCQVPECEGPESPFENPFLLQLAQVGECQRAAPINVTEDVCTLDMFNLNSTASCHTYLYENGETIFAEFALACDEWRRSMVGTIRNAALPLALILTGFISDTYGRCTAFCILAAFAGSMGIIKSFSVNYNMFVSMEFIEAALGYGFNSAGYVLLLESARPSQRSLFAACTGVAYGLGGILFAVIARFVPYWRNLLRVIHTPALLLPLYWLVMDESARWLLTKGRDEEAVSVLRRAARWNKISLDDKLLQEVQTQKPTVPKTSKGNWKLLLRSRIMLTRFAICGWCWIVTAFVYYGLTINSVSLSGDKYTNFALSMAMEVVASLLQMMALERFGRRKCIFVAFVICSIASVMPQILGYARPGLALFLTGKLSITFAFNSLYVTTLELFPTGVRSSALSACSLLGRLGSVLAPLTPMLSLTWQSALYAASAATAALLVLLVPETRRQELPDTVPDDNN